MPITGSDLFHAKNIRLENQVGSRGIYLSWDDTNENLVTSVVNQDETYVPVPLVSESMFNYDVVSPPILSGEFPSTGFNYSNIKLMFDGILGTNTTISGSGVGSYTITSNYIQFNYSYIGQSDTLTITSFNKLNTKSKPFTRTFNLKQILNLPLSWVNAPNTQGYQYTNLVIAFARNVTAFTGVSSQYGNITNPVLYDTNKIKFDYLTPFQTTDIITFSGINDGSVVNSSDVIFNVNNLLLGPVVSGFVSAPTSQSYPYTGLQVTFSKAIQSSNVTASHGTISSISGYGTNTVSFNWTTGSVTNQSVTFSNLVAVDGSIDPDSTEVVNVALQPAPHSPTWFENSPVNIGQQYNVKVAFSENIKSPLPTVSNSNSDPINNISIQDGKLLFTVTPSTNSATYTFSNVYGISGGIAQSLTLSLGASLQSVTVNKNLTLSGDDVYSGSNVVKDKQNKIKLEFSKPLQSAPSISGFTYNSNTGSSYVYTYTPTASVGSVLNFETGLLTGSDSTTSTSQSFSLTVIDSQTILTFREQGSGNELTDMDVGTSYNLVITTSKGIDADVSNTTFEGNPVTRPASTTYNTTYTPSVAGTNQTLSIQNAKDIDLFLYTLYKTGLNFIAVIAKIFDINPNTASFTYSSENIVSQMTSSGYTFTPNGSPPRTITDLNGKLVLQNASGNLSTTANNISGITNATYFLVFKRTAVSLDQYIVGLGSDTVRASMTARSYGAMQFASNYWVETSSGIGDQWVIACGRLVGSNGSIFTRINGNVSQTLQSEPSQPLQPAIGDELVIGGLFPAHVSAYALQGNIARFYMYGSNKSDAEIISEMASLASEYGL